MKQSWKKWWAEFWDEDIKQYFKDFIRITAYMVCGWYLCKWWYGL